MATNARIDDLRKRIEKDPGSRLFAQLAEELRKDGELEEAIRVAREGLKAHPNYPSARMTLGRALLDTGDWASARTEFEMVLKGAPDNILASRYLAECHENLGDRDAAIARYKATLALAPGEKHVLARLQELEGSGAGAAAPARPATAVPGVRPPTPERAAPTPATPAMPAVSVRPPSPPETPAPAPTPPPPPIPVASVEGEMELETSRSFDEPTAVPAAGTPMAPIPLAEVDEEFELERPYESPTTSIGTKAPEREPPPPPPPPPPPARSVPEPEAEDEFELEAPHEAPSTAWAATIRPLPVIDEPKPPAPPAPAAPPALAAPPAFVAPPAPAGPSALISPTLGELYFNQGFTEKAIEVYRELSAREPANERLAARLRELEKLQGALSAGDGAEADAPPASGGAGAGSAETTAADRREAIERTITRLEGLLSAIRKG